MGPFQTTVFAFLMASANSARVFSPMSRPSLSAGMAVTSTVSTSTGAAIGFGKSAATTVSIGSRSLTPFSSAFFIMSLQ